MYFFNVPAALEGKKSMVLDPWATGVDRRREDEFRLAGVRCYPCLGPAVGE